MKIKEGYVINKLGGGYVVVTVGDASRDFNGLIRLNNAGAFLWENIQDGLNTKEKLIQAMMDYYDDNCVCKNEVIDLYIALLTDTIDTACTLNEADDSPG